MGRRSLDIDFCVGEPNGIRSSIWKVWAPENKADLYLTAHSLGKFFKASFHIGPGSGERHYGFVDQGVAARYDHEGERHFTKWYQPGNTSHQDFSVEFRLIFPISSLKTFPQTTLRTPQIRWVPLNSDATDVEILLIVGPALSNGSWPGKSGNGSRFLASDYLSDGRMVWLVYVYNFSKRSIQIPKSKASEDSFQKLFETGVEVSRQDPNANLRMILGPATGEDGSRYLFEIDFNLFISRWSKLKNAAK